jgi:hypothetical protein
VADYTGTTWADADIRLGKRASLNIGWHTRLLRYDDGRIVVRYHDTDVVTYLPDDRTVLRSGGWKSQTTKRRIEDYSRARVWSIGGIWYVQGPTTAGPHSARTPGHLFAEGVTIRPDGTVTKAGTLADKVRESALRAKVKAYAARYFDVLKAGKMNTPGPGDCFYCQIERSNPGEQVRGDHVLSHVREGYLVPSLIWTALQDGIGSEFDKQWVATRMQRDDTDSGDKHLERRFCRWLYRRLGLHY